MHLIHLHNEFCHFTAQSGEPLAEMGYGLLLDEASSDELVQIDGGCFGYCHDTFSKMLFYFAYSELIAWVLKHGYLI